MKPEIYTQFLDDEFIVSYLTSFGRIAFSGDYSGPIEVTVSQSLMDLGVDAYLPYVVRYTRGIVERTTVIQANPPKDKNFFEEDFSGLNNLLFGIESKDFVFSLGD